ncbi:hypothetical protein GCM10027186_47790 [Micromonospora schwarzwaldensis]
MIVALLGGTAIAFEAPAYATESQCGSTSVCLWGEDDYSGCFRGMSTTKVDDYATIRWASPCTARIDNGANSVKNEGTSCSVRLYDGVNQSGSFILFNRELDGANFRDPYLANGGGTGSSSGQNWQDRISSHLFC